jgi:hypothetical protein
VELLFSWFGFATMTGSVPGAATTPRAALVAFAPMTPESSGVVDKVEHQAKIVTGGDAVAARVGIPVHLRDELRTGSAARLKLTFRDGTELTLGEKASVVIDRYIYDLKAGVGETVLQATRGAFRFASGRIKALKHKARSRCRRRWPISASTALSSGAARLTADMACCCWKARSWSPIKPAALCCRGKAKAPTSPLRWIRPVPFEPGGPTKSPAPWPP